MAQATPSDSVLRLPYYDWNACPFECCIYRTWKAKTAIKILTERRLDSPVAFELHAGDSVQAFTGVVVTRRVGEVVALRDGFVGESSTPVRAGDLIRILRYEGEGFWKIWFNGKFDVAEFLNLNDVPSDRGLKVVSRPDTTWWVKVRTCDGRVGWTTATADFEGKAACS